MGDGGEGPSEGSYADEGGYGDGVVLQHVGNNSPARAGRGAQSRISRGEEK